MLPDWTILSNTASLNAFVFTPVIRNRRARALKERNCQLSATIFDVPEVNVLVAGCSLLSIGVIQKWSPFDYCCYILWLMWHVKTNRLRIYKVTNLRTFGSLNSLGTRISCSTLCKKTSQRQHKNKSWDNYVIFKAWDLLNENIFYLHLLPSDPRLLLRQEILKRPVKYEYIYFTTR